jgi:hypothetical protein
MHYTLLFYESPEDFTVRTDPLRKKEYLASWSHGPITETKEQLGGFFIIDVPDPDTALEWAARCPNNAVEIRQNLPALK